MNGSVRESGEKFMGSYVNPNSDGFWEAVNSEIYVDKTELIRYTNKVMRTSQKYVCVSRPRRFGKRYIRILSTWMKRICCYRCAMFMIIVAGHLF